MQKLTVGWPTGARGGFLEGRPGYDLMGVVAAAPTNGQIGWEKGALFFDVTNGVIYRNAGSTTSSSWEVMSSAGSASFTNATVTNLTVTNAAVTNAAVTNGSLSGVLTMGNGSIINANTGNGGLKIGGAASQKIGLWGATPVVQPAGTGELLGANGNAATNANAVNMNSNGNTGAAFYSLGDVVKAMKQAGLLTA